MTDINGWEPQEGGLLLRVDHYDKNDPLHQAAARQALRSTIETVSRTHDAKFSERALYDNMRLLDDADGDDPDLLLELYLAKWDVCEPKLGAPQQREICLGASIGWYTYHFDEGGNLRRAFYEEDTAQDRKQARELLKLKPKGMSLPEKESVAGCLHRIKSQKRHLVAGVDYVQGEVAPTNTAMMRQLSKNNAFMGTGADSAVLEYERLPRNTLDYFPLDVDVKIKSISNRGKKSKRSFIAYWKDGDHDVRFIVTKGRATASGVSRIDITPWDNGNPPDAYTLERVAAFALQAIENEVAKRKWNVQKSPYVPSPLIPLLESRRDIYKAFFQAGADRIIIPNADITSTFDPPMPLIHIHIIGKQHMIKAFKDAQQRFFGDGPTVPGLNDIKSVPKLAQ